MAAAVMLGFGYVWLNFRSRALAHEAVQNNESLVPTAPVAARPAAPDGSVAYAAFAPIALVFLMNYILARVVFPGLDLSYLAEARWGGIRPAEVTGVWAIVLSLTLACLLVLAINHRRVSTLYPAIGSGALLSLVVIIAIASV